jgi:hypothetical protein
MAGPKVSLVMVCKGSILLLLGIEPWLSIQHPSHCTDFAFQLLKPLIISLPQWVIKINIHIS